MAFSFFDKKVGESVSFFICINLLFFFKNLLEEKIFTSKYKDGSSFKHPYLLNCILDLINILSVKKRMLVEKKTILFFIGCMSLLKHVNSLLSFYHTQLFSYRTTQMVNMVKLLPVCLLKIFLFREKIAPNILLSCFITTIGVLIFMYKKEAKTNDFVSFSLFKDIDNSILLTLAMLFGGGLESCLSDRINSVYSISSGNMFFYSSLFSFLPSFLQTIKSMRSITFFFVNNKIAILHIFIKIILSIFGRKLIFLCIQRNGSVITINMLLLRKVLMIIATSVFYGHTLTSYHLLGLSILSIGLFVAVFKPKESSKKSHKIQ